MLQQYLPFTVLKREINHASLIRISSVATVLTVYGIETRQSKPTPYRRCLVATVLTVYGIETHRE